jgi:uncharacterized glyoxalase superfamily protein PhnB
MILVKAGSIATLSVPDHREIAKGTLRRLKRQCFRRCSSRRQKLHGAVLTPANNRSMITEFEVDDVEAERSRLEETIEEWILEPTDQPWGNRSMLFRDPDGNVINFYAPISGEQR